MKGANGNFPYGALGIATYFGGFRRFSPESAVLCGLEN